MSLIFQSMMLLYLMRSIFSNRNVYWKMKKIVDKNRKHKRIIGTGDALQLKPIQELTNTRDYHAYADEIIDGILKTKSILRYARG